MCRHGKTTLLKHIASRALNIPPNIDLLLCEQGEQETISLLFNVLVLFYLQYLSMYFWNCNYYSFKNTLVNTANSTNTAAIINIVIRHCFLWLCAMIIFQWSHCNFILLIGTNRFSVSFLLYFSLDKLVSKLDVSKLDSVTQQALNLVLLIFYTLLCCVEVQADDTKAIDAVVNADKKRLALLEECKQLEKEQQKGDDSHTAQLKHVSCCYSLPCDCQCSRSFPPINMLVICVTIIHVGLIVQDIYLKIIQLMLIITV